MSAFPTPAEADLVDQLRLDGDAIISLVAVDGNDVMGHVLFSTMTAPFKALGLAPVSVESGMRRRGIAARLIEEGIRDAKSAGWEAIFVLGDPAYYQRFGFSAKEAELFNSPYAGPYLMVLALNEGGLPASSGRVEYAPAFAALG